MASIDYRKIGVIGTPVDLADIASYMATLIDNDASKAQAQNDAGGVIGWIIPDTSKLHCAWNAVRVVAVQILYTTTSNPKPTGAPYGTTTLSGDVTQEYYVNTNYRGDLFFGFYINSLLSPLISLEAAAIKTMFEGVSFTTGTGYAGAEFNLSPFIVSAYNPITYGSDYSLARIIYQGSDNENIWCLNGVVQQGDNPAIDWLTASTEHLLTQQTIMQEWGVNDGGDFNDDFNNDFDNTPQSEGSEPVVTIMHVDENGVPTAEQVTIHDETDVESVNTLLGYPALVWRPSCKGIALRWLNNFGGVDQFVFSLKDKRERKAKTAGYADVYSPSPYDVKDTIRVYDIEAADYLTLGAENVPKWIWHSLKWLATSREVLCYMPQVSVKANRWQQVTIDSFDVPTSDDSEAVNVEITIRLPKLNLMV